MAELVLMPAHADLSEIIHVELPHETRKVRMLKVLWKNRRTKDLFILDDEALSMLSPLQTGSIFLSF